LRPDLELLKLLEYEDSIKNIYNRCFEPQRKAALHPGKRKVIRCSRRAGKTELAATKLLQSAMHSPNGICLYVALTRKSAKLLLWSRLKRMAEELSIGFQSSESNLILSLDNGSEIWLTGANQEDVSETLRGHAYRVVILDECASFRGHIDSLIEEILEPATIDEDGELWIMGTPSWDFTSYFYKANHNPEEWDSFYWTLFDNPHIKDAKTWVDGLKKRRGWSDDNPILLREYHGLWVRTNDQMVYLFNPLINISKRQPTKFSQTVLGIDLGFEDKTAFSIVGHEQDSPIAHVIYTERVGHMLIHEMALKAQALIGKHDIGTVVVDEGGLGKSIAEEFRQRYGINCKPAQKRDKRLYIELFNSELKEGRILVDEDNPVIDEWNTLLWDDGKQVEKPGLPNDCADATLYAWRESYYYAESIPKEKPKRNSEEFFREQEDKLLKERINKYKQQEQRGW